MLEFDLNYAIMKERKETKEKKMTTAQIELQAKNFTLEEKAKIVCVYNGQTGTTKQIEKVLKVYKDHDYLDRFIVPRWNAIKSSMNEK